MNQVIVPSPFRWTTYWLGLCTRRAVLFASGRSQNASDSPWEKSSRLPWKATSVPVLRDANRYAWPERPVRKTSGGMPLLVVLAVPMTSSRSCSKRSHAVRPGAGGVQTSVLTAYSTLPVPRLPAWSVASAVKVYHPAGGVARGDPEG